MESSPANRSSCFIEVLSTLQERTPARLRHRIEVRRNHGSRRVAPPAAHLPRKGAARHRNPKAGGCRPRQPEQPRQFKRSRRHQQKHQSGHRRLRGGQGSQIHPLHGPRLPRLHEKATSEKPAGKKETDSESPPYARATILHANAANPKAETTDLPENTTNENAETKWTPSWGNLPTPIYGCQLPMPMTHPDPQIPGLQD